MAEQKDSLNKGLADALNKGKKTTKGKMQSLKKGASDGSDSLSKAAADLLKARKNAGEATKSYTVASGDSLSAIAQKHYGSADKWQAIYEANKALIGDNPNAIKVGQELVLPDLD